MNEDLKCQICGAPATIHLTQIVGGKVTKVHLCEKCAEKHDTTEIPLIKFAEIITKKLFGEKLGKEILEGTVKAFTEKDVNLGKKCPNCGLSESELNKTERFGCPKCYEVFADELNAILPKIQHANAAPASLTSAGTPSKAKDDPAAPKTKEELEKILAEAVAREDYLLAAKTRDQIKAFERKATKSGKKAQTKIPATPTKARGRKTGEASEKQTPRKRKKQ